MTANRLTQIKMLVSDVDGVLTEGTIYYGAADIEMKAFNIKDGLGIRLAGWAGLPVVWLTGRCSDAVRRRAAELQVPVQQGVGDKAAGLRAIAAAHGCTLEEIAYLADDLNDLPALRLAGFPVAVADAVPEVRAIAAYTTQAPGGRGAMREVIEYILRAQGRWEGAVATFLERVKSEG